MSERIALNILDSKGSPKGDMELDPVVFGKGVREAVVYDTVRYQLLKKRAGTHSTLTKSTMKGGGKKPWKQKGTGRARAGSSTSPIWVGGAVAHGPHPRDYTNRTMKRARRQALAGVLREKVLAGGVFCFEQIDTAKTSEFSKLLSGIKVLGKKILYISGAQADQKDSGDAKAVRSARNIAGVRVLSTKAVNTYDVLNSDALVVSKATFEELKESLKSRATKNKAGNSADEAGQSSDSGKKSAAKRGSAKKGSAKEGSAGKQKKAASAKSDKKKTKEAKSAE